MEQQHIKAMWHLGLINFWRPRHDKIIFSNNHDMKSIISLCIPSLYTTAMGSPCGSLLCVFICLFVYKSFTPPFLCLSRCSRWFTIIGKNIYTVHKNHCFQSTYCYRGRRSRQINLKCQTEQTSLEHMQATWSSLPWKGGLASGVPNRSNLSPSDFKPEIQVCFSSPFLPPSQRSKHCTLAT